MLWVWCAGCLFVQAVADVLLTRVFLVLSSHAGVLLSGVASSAQHSGRSVSAWTSRVVSVCVVNAVAHVSLAPVFLGPELAYWCVAGIRCGYSQAWPRLKQAQAWPRLSPTENGQQAPHKQGS